jgi:hypothetical protein
MMISPTNNEAWAFWATIGHRAGTTEAWALAMPAIAAATACGAPVVRDVLDSQYGRHLADDSPRG